MSSYKYNVQELFENSISSNYSLDRDIEKWLDTIILFSEKQKGVLTVVVTGLVYKHFHPEQDVRRHQSSMSDGYSGRTFDTKHITPFMKENQFPSMAESGWLTRSLEQATPYTEGYAGSISGKGLKDAFLNIYNAIETKNCVDDILSYLFTGLVSKRDEQNIVLSVPANLTISETLKLIKDHISFPYKNVSGASRLPNLAIYSAYESIFGNNNGRYKDKILCNLDSHTASDKSTGSIGDVQINYLDGKPFEGIEIKDKKISIDMLDTIYLKIQEHSTVSRYYLLSTYDDELEKDILDEKIMQIRSKHGCDVVVNGVYTTLKYFLRLSDTDSFISSYAKQVSKDKALKYEHREAWNKLCGTLN